MVRESKQGDDTVAQTADTTPTGAPWHRVQNLANPCKPAGAGEAQKKRREGLPGNLRHQGSIRTGTRWQKRQKIPKGTCCRVSCANCRPRRKRTAQGREPSDAPKTPPTQQQGSTAGVGQQTGARKVAEPAKGKLRRHKVENQVVYQDTANPTTNVHCRSRPANRSQKVAEPAKGNQLQDTPRKTSGAPGRGTEATPEEANKSQPHT